MLSVFFMLFGCPTTNFGSFSKGLPDSPNVNRCVTQFPPEGHQEPYYEVESVSLAEQRLNPLGYC